MTGTLAILNPAAGGGRGRARGEPAVARLRAGLSQIGIVWTERPGHATELARAAHEAGVRRFIIGGGDGTVFEVINGLFPRDDDDDPASIGVLPIGTGNSFVRDFDIADSDAAVDAILAGRTRTFDVVRVEHADGSLHYVNLLSIGLPADAGELTNRRFKALGLAGYAVSVVLCLVKMRHPTFPIDADGTGVDSRPCTLLSFSNSRFTGGTMLMAPPADVSDGEVDIIRVGPMGRRRFLRAFPKLFEGTHEQLQEVTFSRAKRIEFTGDEVVDCMIDGEILPLRLRAIEVLPGALAYLA